MIYTYNKLLVLNMSQHFRGSSLNRTLTKENNKNVIVEDDYTTVFCEYCTYY